VIADFPNLRLRDTDELKIDRFNISLHVRSNTLAVAKKWYDNVVVATSYIGPMGSPLAPEAPTGLRVSFFRSFLPGVFHHDFPAPRGRVGATSLSPRRSDFRADAIVR
jgi:hypothetical protein